MKIAVWGIGKILENEIHKIDMDNVVCFIDKKASIMGYQYLNKPLIDCSSIGEFEFDVLIVSSNKYFDEISQQCIKNLGISEEKIIRLDYYLERPNGAYHDCLYKYLANCERDYSFGSWISDWTFPLKEINNRASFNCNGFLVNINNTSEQINIFQITHKPFQPIKMRGYNSIGVGNASGQRILDNTGDNISCLNSKINECTALYWIWKNINADYIGLNHYRRVFSSEINSGWPVQTAEIIGYLKSVDVVVAKHVDFGESGVVDVLRKEVCAEAFEQSMTAVAEIFDFKGMQEQLAFDKIMHGNIFFPCNMFVMSKENVDRYCEWLFPILFELDKKIYIDDRWDLYSRRIIGFWAERLFTVWIYMNNLKIKELPILLLDNEQPFGK